MMTDRDDILASGEARKFERAKKALSEKFRCTCGSACRGWSLSRQDPQGCGFCEIFAAAKDAAAEALGHPPRPPEPPVRGVPKAPPRTVELTFPTRFTGSEGREVRVLVGPEGPVRRVVRVFGGGRGSDFLGLSEEEAA